MGYSEDNSGNVVLTMTPDDYIELLLRLGAANASPGFTLDDSLALINRLNEGNPKFKPYKLLKEKT